MQPRDYRSGPGAPARLALVLFHLALIGGFLIALDPAPPVQRLVAPGSSGSVILLALSPPAPETASPVNYASASVIDETPTNVTPSQPSPMPIPLEAMVADEVPANDNAVADLGLQPSTAAPLEVTTPLAVVEDEPPPRPVTAPEAVTVAVSEVKPAPDTPDTPDTPDIIVPPILAALSGPSDDDEPVSYAFGNLAPDEAAAMPGDTPSPTVVENAPPEVAVAVDAAVIPPLPEQPVLPLIASAKAPLEALLPATTRLSDGTVEMPRIAVVVMGLGLGRAATTAAIKLPGLVTLAFASHARDLQKWIDLARSAGHETLLDLPMEPENYPAIDPGPQALLTSLSGVENAERLLWHLDRASGYVGVTHSMGSRFTASSDHMRPILSALKVRGLMFLDARTSANSVAARLATAIGLPRAINNRFLDTQASRAAIDRRLDEIERIARRVGFSVAISHAYPVTLERLERWIESLEAKKLSLAPISALVNKQKAE